MSDTENPETGMPTHCPMKVNAEGQGPINDDEDGTWGCWCADGLNCTEVFTDVDCEDWQTTDHDQEDPPMKTEETDQERHERLRMSIPKGEMSHPSTDYTPTTDEIRARWESGGHAAYPATEFDRWLAKRDSEAARLGYRRGAVMSNKESARAEAERRWPAQGNPRTPQEWLYEGQVSGFVLGAQWATGMSEAADAIHLSNPEHGPSYCGEPVTLIKEAGDTRPVCQACHRGAMKTRPKDKAPSTTTKTAHGAAGAQTA